MDAVTTRIYVHHEQAADVRLRSDCAEGWSVDVHPVQAWPDGSTFDLHAPAGAQLQLKPQLGSEWALGHNVQVQSGSSVDLRPTFNQGNGRVEVLFREFE